MLGNGLVIAGGLTMTGGEIFFGRFTVQHCTLVSEIEYSSAVLYFPPSWEPTFTRVQHRVATVLTTATV